MRYTPNKVKWLLRFYPPFLFQRIWVKNISPGYTGADVTIHKSFLNLNANRTIFGGTIFSAIDPIYPVLIDAYIRSHGFKKTVAWLKSARIEYKKPGHRSLHFSVRLNEKEMESILHTIREEGKVIRTFSTDIFDKDGIHCATVHNEVYIRNLQFDNNLNNTSTKHKGL